MREPIKKGAPLYVNPDATVSGRYPGFDMFDFLGEYNEETKEIKVQMVLAGTRAQVQEMTFLFDPMAQELPCTTDPSVVLEKVPNKNCPFILKRKIGVVAGNDPW